MPVAAATTPEWMAALLAKKKEKKDDSGLNTKRDAVLSATKATPAWVRNGDTAKSAGKGSPITGRTLLGSPQLRATVAQRNGGLNNFSEASITASDVPKHKAFHSSTLPRSFGGSGAHAAATKNSREAPNNKTTDDTSLKREVDVLLVRSSQQASKAGRVSGNEKSSVARLRDFYTKQPEESEKAASPKLSSRPRATAASASQRQVARTVVATPASSASKLGSTSNTLTTPENNLRRISEERQHSDPFLPSSSLTSAASGRKTSDERQPTSLPKSHGLPASVPDDQSSHRQSRVTSSSSSTLECTNIDDFVAEKGMTIRSFSMSTVDAIQNGSAGEPATPPQGSPHQRRRRNSILVTPERKTKKPVTKRRVSFSEIRLNTVHHFERDEPQPESSDEDDSEKIRRVTVFDDPDGPTTELHPMLSPQGLKGASRDRQQAWSTSKLVKKPEPEEDKPLDMYEDVPEDVAALLW